MLIIEAPENVEALFESYLASGRHWRIAAALEEALWPHRGSRLLVSSYILWLTKHDRSDRITTARRWCELEVSAKHSESHSCLCTGVPTS